MTGHSVDREKILSMSFDEIAAHLRPPRSRRPGRWTMPGRLTVPEFVTLWIDDDTIMVHCPRCHNTFAVFAVAWVEARPPFSTRSCTYCFKVGTIPQTLREELGLPWKSDGQTSQKTG